MAPLLYGRILHVLLRQRQEYCAGDRVVVKHLHNVDGDHGEAQHPSSYIVLVPLDRRLVRWAPCVLPSMIQRNISRTGAIDEALDLLGGRCACELRQPPAAQEAAQDALLVSALDGLPDQAEQLRADQGGSRCARGHDLLAMLRNAPWALALHRRTVALALGMMPLLCLHLQRSAIGGSGRRHHLGSLLLGGLALGLEHLQAAIQSRDQRGDPGRALLLAAAAVGGGAACAAEDAAGAEDPVNPGRLFATDVRDLHHSCQRGDGAHRGGLDEWSLDRAAPVVRFTQTHCVGSPSR